MKICITKNHIKVVLSCLVLSCQNEQIELSINPVSTNLKNETVINGRFFFTSKETLKKSIDDLKSLNNNVLEAKFEKLYQQGFRSHSPIVNPKNYELISKLTQELIYNPNGALAKKKVTILETETEDNTIGDPFFGAFVNQNNEIIVGDSLYKITKKLGVLFVHIKDTTHLYDYLKNLNVKKISKNSKVNQNDIPACEVRSQYPGISYIDDEISSYVAPLDEGGCSSDGGSPIYPPTPQLSDDQLQNLINNLPGCEGEDTSLFQSLFGTNRSCINYFDSNHRIKTEFWDQSWLIYTSIGVQIRTQVKTLGIWWASDADEIHLGINRVYLKYNFPDPEINSQLYLNTYPINTEVPVYMYKGEFKILSDNYGGYIYPTFIKANTSLPFFDFKAGTDMLNIYIRKLPYLSDYNIRSEANIKELYKLGINFLKSSFNTGTSKEFVVSYQKNDSEVEVIYFSEKYKETNAHQVIRYFYEDTEFVVGITYNPDGGTTNSGTGNPNGSFKYTFGPPAQSYFRNYTSFELDFYGLGHQNGIWSGNRMISPK